MAGALIVPEDGTNGGLACEVMRSRPIAQRVCLDHTALIKKLTVAEAMQRSN